MKKSILLAIFTVLIFSSFSFSANLQWDYPSDWADIDGYLLYFNEQGETDTDYIKNIAKADVVEDGVTVTYQNFEVECNMAFGQAYDLHLTAWNLAGESGPSGTIVYTRPEFSPPSDSLPTGTIIDIPNATVTIVVQ